MFFFVIPIQVSCSFIVLFLVLSGRSQACPTSLEIPPRFVLIFFMPGELTPLGNRRILIPCDYDRISSLFPGAPFTVRLFFLNAGLYTERKLKLTW